MPAPSLPDRGLEVLLGCGNRREKVLYAEGRQEWLPGHRVLLDMDPSTGCDLVADLEDPLPFHDNQARELHAYEVLEHLGHQGDWRSWFRLWDELYRVLEPNGVVFATVPRWDSIWAFGDPGHRRIVHPAMLTFLVRPAYGQVGQTAMTDYRPFFVSDWNIVHQAPIGEHQYGFAMQAIKPAR